MVKKHKRNSKKKSQLSKISKSWIVGVVILMTILIIIAKTNKSNPFLPTPINKNFSVQDLTSDQTYYVNQAISDLEKKLKIKKEDVKVVSVKVKQWNDSSLGCPEKGFLYVQSITPGYIIELSYDGKIYLYNAGLDRVVIC